MDNNNKIPVFVYGSLMCGLSNSRLLRDATFVGVAETKKRWPMVSLGGFSAVLDTHAGGTRVVGELYLVDEQTFETLDRLKGFPGFYSRDRVEIELYRTGATRTAWMYMLDPERLSNYDYDTVPAGDWRVYLDRKRRERDEYAPRVALVFGDEEI